MSEQNTKTITVEDLHSDIDYLFGKINFGASFLDAKAVTIMNSLKSNISLIAGEKHTELQPKVDKFNVVDLEESYVVKFSKEKFDKSFFVVVLALSEEDAENKFNEIPNKEGCKFISAVHENDFSFKFQSNKNVRSY